MLFSLWNLAFVCIDPKQITRPAFHKQKLVIASCKLVLGAWSAQECCWTAQCALYAVQKHAHADHAHSIMTLPVCSMACCPDKKYSNKRLHFPPHVLGVCGPSLIPPGRLVLSVTIRTCAMLIMQIEWRLCQGLVYNTTGTVWQCAS